MMILFLMWPGSKTVWFRRRAGDSESWNCAAAGAK
jgi:hypothetical protein